MDKIEEFIDKRYSKANSKNAVRSNLRRFFKVIKKDPNTYITVDVRRLSRNETFDLFDEIEADLTTFVQSIEDIPKKSQVAYLSAIKKFLEWQYVDFPTRTWEDLKLRNNLKNPKPSVETRTPTPEELEVILQRGGIREKAFFLLMATSGMRIGEVSSLRMDDIDIDARTVFVKDDSAKNGSSRRTSFTTEVQKYLRLWVKERENIVTTGYKKSLPVRKMLQEKGYTLKRFYEKKKYVRWSAYKDGEEVCLEQVLKEDDRLFPYNSGTMRGVWNRLLERVGMDQTSKCKEFDIHKYSPHCLRRYFKTYLRSAGMRKDYIDFMVAHGNVLDETYTDATVFQKTVQKEYDKYCDSLNVFSDYSKVKTELDPKIDSMKINISSLVTHNSQLKEKIDELAKTVEFYRQENQHLSNHYSTEYNNNEDNLHRIKSLEEKVEILVKMLNK